MFRIKKNKWPYFIMFTIASAIVKAFVAKSLLEPAHMLPAGTTGISMALNMILKSSFNIEIGYWWMFFAINAPILVWAYTRVNRKVVIKTIIYVVCFTIISKYMPVFHVSDNVILLTLLGGIGVGTHISLMLYIGGTTGGVDLIGMYVSKKYNSEAVSTVNNFNNIIIFTILGYIIDPERGILSFIGAFLASMVVEKYHMQSNFTMLMIVSKRKNSINQYCTEKLKRTNIMIESHRGYNVESDNTMFITLPKYRLNQVLKDIKSIDNEAYMISIPVERVHHKIRSAVGESMI